MYLKLVRTNVQLVCTNINQFVRMTTSPPTYITDTLNIDYSTKLICQKMQNHSYEQRCLWTKHDCDVDYKLDDGVVQEQICDVPGLKFEIIYVGFVHSVHGKNPKMEWR